MSLDVQNQLLIQAVLPSATASLEKPIKVSQFPESLFKINFPKTPMEQVIGNYFVFDKNGALKIASEDEINLYKSALERNNGSMRFYLDRGASPNVIDRSAGFNRTPLYWAIYHGEASDVKLLIDSGVNPNFCTSEEGVGTAYMMAIRWGRTQSADIIVRSSEYNHKLTVDAMRDMGIDNIKPISHLGINETKLPEKPPGILGRFLLNRDYGPRIEETSRSWGPA